MMIEQEGAIIFARAQFAFTVSFHFLFPAFFIGLASFLAVLEGLWLKTGKGVYAGLSAHWERAGRNSPLQTVIAPTQGATVIHL